MKAQQKPVKTAKRQPPRKPIIKLDTDAPEILASAIIEVADSAKALLTSRLSGRAILVLLKDQTGLPMADIEKVLVAASELGRYVKKR
jgi:hypothetical protein